MERLSARERERIAELLAEGAPFWRLRQEVPTVAVRDPSGGEAVCGGRRRRSRTGRRCGLSLAEREEISRGLAAGESLRVDRWPAGPGAVDGVT